MTKNIQKLSADDFQEIVGKLEILVDNEDSLEESNLTSEEIAELIKTIPSVPGYWEVPARYREIVKGEILNHVDILRACAEASRSHDDIGQSLSISRQAARLERFAETITTEETS